MQILKNNIFATTLVLLGVGIVLISIFSFNKNAISQPAQKGTGFAVVELFTSEGCSSCPPADRVLSVLITEAREENKNIYGLSFHVDYWDYIGWKDPYSDKKYSNRQRTYGQAFNNNRIYTPQMIVNGMDEFVGSNRSKAEKSVRNALKNSSSVLLELDFKIENNKVAVTCNVPGLSNSAMVNLALVERNLAQDVKRGENRGRLLKHDNVVRDFKVFRTEGASVIFNLNGIKIEDASVVAYVQDVQSMKISGATAKQLVLWN